MYVYIHGHIMLRIHTTIYIFIHPQHNYHANMPKKLTKQGEKRILERKNSKKIVKCWLDSGIR